MKIAILTNIIPSYREGFYNRLFNRKEVSLTVYCQDHIPGRNLKSIHEKYGENVQIVQFLSADKEKVVWQFIPWRGLLNNYDVVFVEGNPRMLTNVLISLALHFFRKGVVIWTQAHSFRNNKVSENIRLFWLRLYKNIFVYTDKEVEFLKNKGFKATHMLGMNNGLDQKIIDQSRSEWPQEKLQAWRQANALTNRRMVLSCARLDAKNKFDQVIQALPLIISQVPDILLCIIGDGDERINLEGQVSALGLNNKVRFVGALYAENELAPWFLCSEVLIHPAAIGLTLMHSFGYGLPVITHGIANLHNPEYAAFEPEKTGRNFKIGDISDLAQTVVGLLNEQSKLLEMKAYVLQVAREKYNVDIMVEQFLKIARLATNAKK